MRSILLASLVIALSASSAFAADPDLDTRKAAIRDIFINKSSQSCQDSLASSDEAKKVGLVDESAKKYCTCTTTKLFDSMSEDELKGLFQTSDISDSTKARAQQYSIACLQGMINKN